MATVDKRLCVPRPDGRDPAKFAQVVAVAYAAATKRTHHNPCKLIADASGVPVTTVHRWVSKARTLKAIAPRTDAVERLARELGVDATRLRNAIRKVAPGGIAVRD